MSRPRPRANQRPDAAGLVGAAVETDVLFYRRRISEELAAAERAITGAARARHFQLIDAFVARLEVIGEKLPISRDELERLRREDIESRVA